SSRLAIGTARAGHRRRQIAARPCGERARVRQGRGAGHSDQRSGSRSIMIRLSPRTTIAACICMLATGGCLSTLAEAGHELQNRHAADRAEAEERDAAVKEIEEARAAAEARPGLPKEAIVFARQVPSGIEIGVVEQRKLDKEGLVSQAAAALDRAAQAHREESAILFGEKGKLFLVAGHENEGMSALRASMDARPTVPALANLLAK